MGKSLIINYQYHYWYFSPNMSNKDIVKHIIDLPYYPY